MAHEIGGDFRHRSILVGGFRPFSASGLDFDQWMLRPPANVGDSFYTFLMAVATRSTSDELARLRAQLDRVERKRAEAPVLPTAPVIADLLPERGLRVGGTYAVPESTSLLLALLAEPSQAGKWCAIIGIPWFGAEAAAGFGIDLERVVLVPEPGDRWLAVAAAVSEVVPLVVLRPGGRVRDADAARLSARLRDRGGVLLVQGMWPDAQAVLTADDPEWSGLDEGAGVLESRTVTITATSRRAPSPKRARVRLPGATGALEAVSEAAAVQPIARLRAAG